MNLFSILFGLLIFYVGYKIGDNYGFTRACHRFEESFRESEKKVNEIRQSLTMVTERFDKLEPRKSEKML